ncbi:helix-turn-helix domain-containing protein [Plebeiibacterium sediminum]|uniref:Helix-turn-helix domain-containing protein n=1 Tax=Plebeiibacterium sediminum TaxID=2992112 RepID=A0AAE3M999_9BACT|nr:helix-turn-helix domain-containing protein [Plebeiobacterium sediminum]MCW3789351.1 helix-turn-helix domain-containing protein [Plebeiobacterium sediminum]
MSTESNTIIVTDKETLNKIINDAVYRALEEISYQKKPPSDKDIGGIELAMEITGYAKSTIYNLVNSDKIPYIKKYGRLYFSREDLLSFLKSGKNVIKDNTNILK